MLKVPTCSLCGSSSLSKDAVVRWNIKKQDWEITGVFDDVTCDECEFESSEYTEEVAYPFTITYTNPHTGTKSEDFSCMAVGREDAIKRLLAEKPNARIHLVGISK